MRHGHMPERTIQTGIGPVAVRQPRVRDRGAADGERIRFSSTLLPPYARRTKTLDALLPILYLRGISTGDMQEALAALLGKDAPNLSHRPSPRLKAGWQENQIRSWKKARSVGAPLCLYLGGRRLSPGPHGTDDKQCILVLIGATPEGRKELIGFHRWCSGSAQSWRELLARSEGQRSRRPPELADWRRRARLLEGRSASSGRPRAAALLGAQDDERARTSCRKPAAQGQARISTRSGWPRQGARRGERLRPLPR